MSSINAMVAAEHQADLRKAAHRWELGSTRNQAPDLMPQSQAQIILRLAQSDDADRVRRLAVLDEAPALEGQVLLALVDDTPVAALSLGDGRTVSDPFVFTEDALALLRLRRTHLWGRGRRRRARRAWRALLPTRRATD